MFKRFGRILEGCQGFDVRVSGLGGLFEAFPYGGGGALRAVLITTATSCDSSFE